MLRSLGHEEESRSLIEKSYSEEIVFANDLDCFPIP